MSLNRLNGRLNRKVPNSLDSGLDRIAKSRNNKLVVEAILSRTGQHQQDLVDSDPLPISRSYAVGLTDLGGVNDFFRSNFIRNMERFEYQLGRAKSTDDESNAIHEYLKSIITALERYLLLVNRKTSISTSDQAPQTTLSQLLLIWNHLYQQYTDYLIDRDETVRQMLKQLQKFEEENILLKEIISTHSRFSNENTMVILRDYQQKLIKYRNSLRNQDFATTTATTTLTSSDSQSNVKTIFEHASSQTVYCDIDEAANIIDQQSARSRKISVQAETQTAAAATTVKTPLPVQKPTLNAAAQTDCLPQPHAVERSPTSLEQEVLDEQVGHLVVDQLNKCWPVAAVPSEPPIKLSDKALLTPNQPVEAQAVTRNPAYDPDDEIAQMSQAELVRTVKDRNGELAEMREQFVKDRQKLEQATQEFEEYRTVRESEFQQMAIENQAFRKERYNMRAELDRLKGENGELMEHLDCAESDLTSATARLATADSELTQLRQLIDGAPRELEMAREQYKQQLEECERRIQHSEATKQELDGQVSNTNARLDKTLAEVAHLQHVLADREETIRQLQIKQDTMQSDMNILIGNNDLNERLLRGDQDPNNGSVDLMELCQRNVVANNIRIRLLQQQNTEIREQMLMASVERASSDGGCFKLASTRPIQLAKPPMNMRRILAASNTVLQAYELHHQTVLGVGPNFDQVEQISAEQTPVWHPHLQNFTPISGSRPQTARIVDMEVQPVELKQVEVCWPNVDSAYT